MKSKKPQPGLRKTGNTGKKGTKGKVNIRLDSLEPRATPVPGPSAVVRNVETPTDGSSNSPDGILMDANVNKKASKTRKLSAKEEAKKLEADLIKRNGYVCYLCPEDESAPYMNYDNIRQHIIRIHKGCKDCLSVYPDFEEAETCQDSPYFCHACRICIETEIDAIQHFAQIHHGNVKPRETRLPVVRKGNGSADLKAKWDSAPVWYCEKCDWFLPRIGKSRAHRCVPYKMNTGIALPQGKRGECHICMEGFDDLPAHVNARHFPCDDYDKFFAAGSTLELHVAEQHPPEETEEQ